MMHGLIFFFFFYILWDYVIPVFRKDNFYSVILKKVISLVCWIVLLARAKSVLVQEAEAGSNNLQVCGVIAWKVEGGFWGGFLEVVAGEELQAGFISGLRLWQLSMCEGKSRPTQHGRWPSAPQGLVAMARGRGVGLHSAPPGTRTKFHIYHGCIGWGGG